MADLDRDKMGVLKLWAALACCGAIVVACMLPHRDLPAWTAPPVDKLLHLASFCVLGAVLGWRARPVFAAIAFVSLVALAGAIEWAQAAYTMDRSLELNDALFGIVGGGFGLALAAFWPWNFKASGRAY